MTGMNLSLSCARSFGELLECARRNRIETYGLKISRPFLAMGSQLMVGVISEFYKDIRDDIYVIPYGSDDGSAGLVDVEWLELREKRRSPVISLGDHMTPSEIIPLDSDGRFVAMFYTKPNSGLLAGIWKSERILALEARGAGAMLETRLFKANAKASVFCEAVEKKVEIVIAVYLDGQVGEEPCVTPGGAVCFERFMLGTRSASLLTIDFGTFECGKARGRMVSAVACGADFRIYYYEIQ